MRVIKCFACGCFLHEDEVVWIELDDNHSAPYCVSCTPEQHDNNADYEG